MYEQNLSAVHRGYRQPGKKLCPRALGDNMHRDQMQVRSMRELRRVCAEEAAAYGYRPENEPHVARFERAMARLNSANQRWVYRLLESNGEMPAMPRAVRRAYLAAIEMDQIERCIEWNRKTLANAY